MRTTGRWLAAGAAAMLAATVAHPYTIVMRGGTTFEASGPPTWEADKVVFDLPGGSRGFLPSSLVDRAATEAANAVPPPLGAHYVELPAAPDPLPSERPAPPLGLISPGGNAKSSYRQDDLETSELALDAYTPEQLERKLAAVQGVYQRLKQQYDALGLEIDRIQRDLALLQAKAAALRPAEPPPAAAPPPDDDLSRVFTNVDLMELP